MRHCKNTRIWCREEESAERAMGGFQWVCKIDTGWRLMTDGGLAGTFKISSDSSYVKWSKLFVLPFDRVLNTLMLCFLIQTIFLGRLFSSTWRRPPLLLLLLSKYHFLLLLPLYPQSDLSCVTCKHWRKPPACVLMCHVLCPVLIISLLPGPGQWSSIYIWEPHIRRSSREAR